jgi:hypothetical protein
MITRAKARNKEVRNRKALRKDNIKEGYAFNKPGIPIIRPLTEETAIFCLSANSLSCSFQRCEIIPFLS